MKQVFFLIVILFSLVFIQCQKDTNDSYPHSLTFYTEQYKPFNYVENNQLTGLAPEILREICAQLEIPFSAETLPWDEAYTKTLETENAVLFSTALNSERSDKFKWAGPIASLDWQLYASSQNHIVLNSLEDARNVGNIGVLKDYAITQYLEDQGFQNLVYFNNETEALHQLLAGNIDLFPSVRLSIESSLEEMEHTYYAVNPRLRVLTDMVYFAFNKNIPDVVVTDFQREIDRMKNNGQMKALHEKFMQSSEVPGSLLIYTEDYPPLTYVNSYGEITGFGSDIIGEIMKRNQIYTDIKLSQWNIGYELALNNPNFCLFTMDRTPIRDTLFQWVGPLGTNSTYFYTKTGSGITILSLDDAKNLDAVGTVSSWFSDQYLRELGFTNLVSGGDPETMTEKLMQGEIDAFVCSGVTFTSILRGIGYDPDQVSASFELMSSDYYIAFSHGTSVEVVNQWQQTLDAMKQDGTYDNIYSKWLQ